MANQSISRRTAHRGWPQARVPDQGRRERSLLAAALAVAGLACGEAHPEDLRPDDLTRSTAQLTAEVGGGVAEVVARRYAVDPDALLASYTAPSMGGCSATMIGPNIIMSAAHCGAFDHTATFRTYRDGNPAVSDTESFTCRHLLQTFSDTDLILLYCEPNPAGESPGDKYGYLDLETRRPVVGQQVYSVWTNPVDSLQLPDARIYSEGVITSVKDGGWFTPGDLPIAVTSSVWGQPGASGSSTLDRKSHRILVGPTSVASFGGARWKAALSIKDYLWHGAVDGASKFGLARTQLAALGLVPDHYAGWVDKDLDNLFDVQTDIERRQGEHTRDHYWLGFESERRNALWTVGPQTVIDAPNRTARTTLAYGVALTHGRLNLKPNTSYRGSIMIYTSSASSPRGLEVAFVHGAGGGRRVIDRQTLSTAVNAGWQLQSFQLRTDASGAAAFEIGTAAKVDLAIMAVSLIEDGSIMDFDTADKRANWRNENDGTRSFIVPDGKPSGTPNFALKVFRDPRRPSGQDWPARNRQLALTSNRWHRICFEHRSYTGIGSKGTMRIWSGTSLRREVSFTPTAAWQQACADWFFVPSGDTNVQFGIDSPATAHLAAALPASYLVDNVRVELGGSSCQGTGGNLLNNANMDARGPRGDVTEDVAVLYASSVSQSAAASWTMYANSLATQRTRHLPGGALGEASPVLHVDTTGKDSGIVQVFRALHTGPARGVARARVYVERGSVGLLGGNGGNGGYLATTSVTGRWVWLEGENAISPFNEVTVYAASPGGAEFYVDQVSVEACEGSSWR